MKQQKSHALSDGFLSVFDLSGFFLFCGIEKESRSIQQDVEKLERDLYKLKKDFEAAQEKILKI